MPRDTGSAYQPDTGTAHREALLSPDARAASHARSLVRDSLAGVPAESLETLLLLTSELVGNAVRHGSGPVRLRLDSRPPGMPFRIRVGVADADPRPPRRGPTREPLEGREVAEDFPPESGRGVLLLDALASRWGVEDEPPGKQVWFELDLPA